MALAKILGRGQVTLPSEIRQAAHLKAGDVVSVEVVGPGQLRVTLLPKLDPDELHERYPIDGPIDESSDRAAWLARAANDAIDADDADE